MDAITRAIVAGELAEQDAALRQATKEKCPKCGSENVTDIGKAHTCDDCDAVWKPGTMKAFDEDMHPRDENGKFSAGGDASAQRYEAISSTHGDHAPASVMTDIAKTAGIKGTLFDKGDGAWGDNNYHFVKTKGDPKVVRDKLEKAGFALTHKNGNTQVMHLEQEDVYHKGGTNVVHNYSQYHEKNVLSAHKADTAKYVPHPKPTR